MNSASAVSSISWLEVESSTRGRTYLEEALWSLGISLPANASLLEQADALASKPVAVLREYVSDKTLLLAFAELENVEFPDTEQCARIRTFASRVLYDIFGYEVTRLRQVVLSACANLLVGERQTIEYVRNYFRSLV